MRAFAALVIAAVAAVQAGPLAARNNDGAVASPLCHDNEGLIVVCADVDVDIGKRALERRNNWSTAPTSGPCAGLTGALLVACVDLNLSVLDRRDVVDADVDATVVIDKRNNDGGNGGRPEAHGHCRGLRGSLLNLCLDLDLDLLRRRSDIVGALHKRNNDGGHSPVDDFCSTLPRALISICADIDADILKRGLIEADVDADVTVGHPRRPLVDADIDADIDVLRRNNDGGRPARGPCSGIRRASLLAICLDLDLDVL